MDRLRVEDTAMFEGIQRYVNQHDEVLATRGGLDERMRLKDSAAAIYILTAQRDVDAGDDGLTTIEVISKWPPQLQLDTVGIARHLLGNCPSSLRVGGADDSITVQWFLRPGPYLLGRFAQRTTDVITWISKLRCVRWATWCIVRIHSQRRCLCAAQKSDASPRVVPPRRHGGIKMKLLALVSLFVRVTLQC